MGCSGPWVGVWEQTVGRCRGRWLNENLQLLAQWFYPEKELYPADDKPLGWSPTSSWS